MVKDAREIILDDMEATLAAIATPTFNTDVAAVFRDVRTWTEAKIDTPGRPSIGFAPGVRIFEWFPARRARITFRVDLMCHVPEDTVQDDQVNAVNLFLNDIIEALETDPTRGGNAVMTTIAEDETDELDKHGGISMRVGVDVVYHASFGI